MSLRSLSCLFFIAIPGSAIFLISCKPAVSAKPPQESGLQTPLPSSAPSPVPSPAPAQVSAAIKPGRVSSGGPDGSGWRKLPACSVRNRAAWGSRSRTARLGEPSPIAKPSSRRRSAL